MNARGPRQNSQPLPSAELRRSSPRSRIRANLDTTNQGLNTRLLSNGGKGGISNPLLRCFSAKSGRESRCGRSKRTVRPTKLVHFQCWSWLSNRTDGAGMGRP